MLQGYFWGAHQFGWYKVLAANAQAIKDAPFDYVWFPPPTRGVVPEGYMPTEWYDLNSRYGTVDELKTAISSLRPTRAIADIVVNHRCGAHTAGPDFENPRFPDNAAAVVSDDECGLGTGRPDSGEGTRDYGRDLDHTNPDVQAVIIEWLRWLKKDIGYAGWRYDMVKGYGAEFVGKYNDATQPELSVGEYYDGDGEKVARWIGATGGRSMAFDFPTRGRLKEALAKHEFGGLKTKEGKPAGVIGAKPGMSVTFIENHDTEPVRGNGEAFPSDSVMPGYAYILTHPGIPCVFWRHYFDCGEVQKEKIRKLIEVRKRNHLNSRSTVDIKAADGMKYAAQIDGKVAVKIGPGPWSPGDGWHVVVDGNDFAVWERRQ
jgi:alpha-amylase